MRKILYIDDDIRSLDDMATILCSRGYEILHVGNTIDAIAITNEYFSNISLILLDLMMNPGVLDIYDTNHGLKTGLVLYQQHLKKLMPNVPVIVITAIISSDVLEEVKKEKMVYEILQKPVGITTIADCIKEALNN